jgi:hypothetical protein
MSANKETSANNEALLIFRQELELEAGHRLAPVWILSKAPKS